MFRPLTASVRKPAPRRGALLIAVLGLLTLFAIFALFFVFYADNEANGARIFREGESDGDSGPPNDFALAAYNSAMRSIVFDEYDSASGAMNSLRGHSLARSMYSWNGTAVGPSASAPFSGIGTFHEMAPNGMDRAAWIHYAAPYTVPATMATAQFPANTYYLDPEWTGWRTAGEVSANTLPGATTRLPTFPPQVHVPKNAPYTYPDLKDLILASLSPATGEVLVPSLHRNWLFNSLNLNQHLRLAPWNPADTAAASNTAANTDWITPEGRTRILRPRPVDQLIPADFSNPATSDPFDAIPTGPSAQYPFALPFTPAALPYPILPGHSNYNANLLNGLYNRIMQRIQQGRIIPYPPFNADGGYTGDLQNLMGSVGIQRNDSILIDIGLPPRKWNNRWIKPLVSILLSDLDGLLNLNAHGNMRGAPEHVQPPPPLPGNEAYARGLHSSYSGFGPSEVNLGAVLGDADAQVIVRARYYGQLPWRAWQPSTMYAPNDVVMNYGNFYMCVNPTPGPFSSAAAAPNPAPFNNQGHGPKGSGYTTAAPCMDGAVMWADYSIGLSHHNNVFLGNHADRLVPVRWAQSTGYSVGARVQGLLGGFYVCRTAGVSAVVPPGPTGTATSILDNTVEWSYYEPAKGPAYSSVNFDAGGNGNSTPIQPSFAGGNAFATNPTFLNNSTQDFFGESYHKSRNHPLLFNPSDWQTGLSHRRLFGLGDLRRFNSRYAADRDFYTQTEVARFAPVGSLISGALAPNSYRLDGAHPVRGLVTTLSTSLDSPSLVSNFSTSGGAPDFRLIPAPGVLHPTHVTPGAFAGGAGNDYLGLQDYRNPKSVPELAPGDDPRKGILGGVDLNRHLTDYRRDTLSPLSSTNVADAAPAWTDRQNLARDIFGRLIVATGANATVFSRQVTIGTVTYYPGDIVINATPGPGAAAQQQYNALRYLAQLSANIVDYIDGDDVSTAFIWNPVDATGPIPLRQFDATTFTTDIAPRSMPTAPTRAVFGVEKTRLVINEAYGEITNRPDDAFAGMNPPTENASVRFWVELLNPTSAPYSSGSGPLGNGEVRLVDPTFNPGFNPYRIEISQVNAANQNDLVDPSNITGRLTAIANRSLTYDFSTAGAAQRVVAPVAGAYAPIAPNYPGIMMVGPPAFTNQHSDGTNMIEFSPNANAPYNSRMIEGAPAGAGAATNRMEYDFNAIPTSANLENVANMQEMRRHAILLRRLANPYLQHDPNTNPYVTVDIMDHVPTFDAVARGMGETMNRSPKTAAAVTTQGFEPVEFTSGGNRRFSVGKVQPYVGYSNIQAAANGAGELREVDSFPNSFVVRQNPSVPVNAEPLHSFFRNNGRAAIGPTGPLPTYTAGPPSLINNPAGETIMAPFDWFVHPDRPIVNQTELFSLQATKPHEVTQYTIQPPAAALQPIRRGMGLAPWLGVSPTGQVNFDNHGLPTFDNSVLNPGRTTNNGLFRALEVLRVKPWTYGVGFEGKQHGKININTIQDIRVLQGLLDARSNKNAFSTTDVDALWNSYITGPGGRTFSLSSRSRANGVFDNVPSPGPSIYDIASGSGFNLDRPFRPLGGVPELLPDGSNSVLVSRSGAGLHETLLRPPMQWVSGMPYLIGQRASSNGFTYTCVVAGTSGGTGPTGTGTGIIDGTVQWDYLAPGGQPLIWSTNANSSHPYQQAEMFRKMFNNTTTTSNAFGVSITVVFHEVRMTGVAMETVMELAGRPRYLIGKEAFKDVPGDLRQQFYSVIDRANIALHADPTLPQVRFLDRQPFFGAIRSGPTQGSTGWKVYIENGSANSLIADGRVANLGNYITLGSGTDQEVVQVLGYEADGAVRISVPTRNHHPGELISNAKFGNPGPVNAGNASNPGPFDPLNQNANNPYRAVVPYAQRIR